MEKMRLDASRRLRTGTLNKFCGDRRGATLVEFGLIAAILFFAIFYVVELGLTHVTTLQLESATSNVARVVRTGRLDSLKLLSIDRKKDDADRSDNGQSEVKPTDDDLTEEDVKAFVCARMAFAVNCLGKTRVFIQEFQGLGGISTVPKIADPFKDDKVKFDGNGLGGSDYILVTVVLQSTLSILGKRYDLRASTVARNEPF